MRADEFIKFLEESGFDSTQIKRLRKLKPSVLETLVAAAVKRLRRAKFNLVGFDNSLREMIDDIKRGEGVVVNVNQDLMLKSEESKNGSINARKLYFRNLQKNLAGERPV